MLNKLKLDDFNCNPFRLIGNQWMLITAGDIDDFNTMTASWGGLGFLWKESVSTIYVRPNRYTKEFIDRSGIYTLSFFDEKYRDVLTYCGSHSGKDVDKIKETSLTPCKYGEGISFKQAELVLVCEKKYVQDMKENCFLDKQIVSKWYDNDFHTMYIGKINEIYS